MDKQKKIGILTSGGDAPGMNAAIRSVVRTAIYNDIKVIGIRRGFEGLLSGDIFEMTPRTVSNIISSGGTILLTARSEEMRTEAGTKKAAEICRILGLDAVVIIGGDGSLRGGRDLSKEGVNVIGIPGTIDLDLPCTEYTIGFDTAVNTGMEAISKIQDTSSSHERCSVVEVMGRQCGAIAMWCSITGGAEEVLAPELPDVTMEVAIQQIIANRAQGKKRNLVVVAEGVGDSKLLASEIERITGIETRATILGHLQRGGSPTATDRMQATFMGYKAVEALLEGERNRVIIYKSGQHTSIDLEEALQCERVNLVDYYKMLKVLAI